VTDTLNKLIPRVPATNTSTSNLFASSRALNSGTGHIFLTSDLNHLANISAVRTVLTHQGFKDFWIGPYGSDYTTATPGGYSNPPLSAQFDWSGPFVGYETASLYADIRVDTYGADALPKVVLRCWVQAPPSGTETVGVVLAVVPRRVIPEGQILYTSTLVTSTVGVDVDLSVQLRAQDLYAWSGQPSLGRTTVGTAPVGEPFGESVCTVWVGFFSTAVKNSDLAQALGITVSLESP
jgi:hypothetical protein